MRSLERRRPDVVLDVDDVLRNHGHDLDGEEMDHLDLVDTQGQDILAVRRSLVDKGLVEFSGYEVSTGFNFRLTEEAETLLDDLWLSDHRWDPDDPTDRSAEREAKSDDRP